MEPRKRQFCSGLKSSLLFCPAFPPSAKASLFKDKSSGSCLSFSRAFLCGGFLCGFLPAFFGAGFGGQVCSRLWGCLFCCRRLFLWFWGGFWRFRLLPRRCLFVDNIAHLVDAAVHAVAGFFQSGLRVINRVSEHLATLLQIASERRGVSNLDALFLQELVNVLIEIVFSQFLHTLSPFEKNKVCQIMATKESIISKIYL